MFNLGIVSVCLGHIAGNLSLMSLTSSPTAEARIGVAVDLLHSFVCRCWDASPVEPDVGTGTLLWLLQVPRPAVAFFGRCLSFSQRWGSDITALVSLNQGTFRNFSHLLLRDGAGICVVHWCDQKQHFYCSGVGTYNVTDEFGFPASHDFDFVDIAIQKQQAQRELSLLVIMKIHSVQRFVSL